MAVRWKVTIAYKGSHFLGWQRLPKGRTVQQEIEQLLKKIHREQVLITGSGRTDRGVSAESQVFHFDSFLRIPKEQWLKIFRMMLPSDIYVKEVEEVDPTFHARRNVTKKRYNYYIECGEYNVLESDYVYQLNRSVDLERMREAAKLFVGTKDFTAFNSTPLDIIENQVRTLREITITQQGSKVVLSFLGKGFLRHMVRMIVAVILDVGLGRMEISDIEAMFEQNDKEACKFKANAEGLRLMEVFYD